MPENRRLVEQNECLLKEKEDEIKLLQDSNHGQKEAVTDALQEYLPRLEEVTKYKTLSY